MSQGDGKMSNDNCQSGIQKQEWIIWIESFPCIGCIITNGPVCWFGDGGKLGEFARCKLKVFMG